MACQTYCEQLTAQPINDPCVDEKGGIIAAGFIKSSYTFVDPEDDAEWTTAVANNDVFVMYNTRGEYDGGAVQTSDDGFGEAETYNQSQTHGLTIEWRGIHEGTGGARDNIDFANTLLRSPGQYFAFFVDGNRKLWISDRVVTVASSAPIPKNKKEIEFFSFGVTWNFLGIPQTYDAPATAYDCAA